MAHPRKAERRLLTESEVELVEKSRQTVVSALDDAAVNDLVAQLRERRDRALTIANNQRRALRGKGGRGEVTFDKADSGNRQKASVLTDALTRARREQTRRRAQSAKAELVENAHKALELKRDSKRAKRPANLPRGNSGMKVKERTWLERIGSAAGEAGRVTKFVAVAQAKKDSRG